MIQALLRALTPRLNRKLSPVITRKRKSRRSQPSPGFPKERKRKEKTSKILKKHRCPADISVTDIYYSTCFTVCQYLFKKSFGILRFYSRFTVLQFLYSTGGSYPLPFHSSSVVSSSSSASSFTGAVGAMRAWASGFASTARRIPSSLTWVYIWVVFSCS